MTRKLEKLIQDYRELTEQIKSELEKNNNFGSTCTCNGLSENYFELQEDVSDSPYPLTTIICLDCAGTIPFGDLM